MQSAPFLRQADQLRHLGVVPAQRLTVVVDIPVCVAQLPQGARQLVVTVQQWHPSRHGRHMATATGPTPTWQSMLWYLSSAMPARGSHRTMPELRFPRRGHRKEGADCGFIARNGCFKLLHRHHESCRKAADRSTWLPPAKRAALLGSDLCNRLHAHNEAQCSRTEEHKGLDVGICEVIRHRSVPYAARQRGVLHSRPPRL